MIDELEDYERWEKRMKQLAERAKTMTRAEKRRYMKEIDMRENNFVFNHAARSREIAEHAAFLAEQAEDENWNGDQPL